MKLEREIRLERHAYDRYCERVQPVGWQELEKWIAEQMAAGCRFAKGYLRTGDVWWRATKRENAIIIHTCYGRHHIDLPRAIHWAKIHKDRIALGVED